MASQGGRQRARWSAGERRRAKTASAPADPEPGPPDDQAVPATVPDTADIYRSLFNQLCRTFGGTIEDANAEAIAFAATELYRKDVEPRLWEHKTAQEILDTMGVPRAGAFSRYSLSDRLLLLRRSPDPDRTGRAEALLDELGAPELDESGARLSLKDRLRWLVEDAGPLPTPPRPATRRPADPDEDEPGDQSPEPMASSLDGDRAPDGAPSEQLVEALETIRHAAGADGGDGMTGQVPAPAAGAPAAELVGLGMLIAGLQEELLGIRQAVETLQSSVDEALLLLRSQAAEQVTAPPPAGPAVDVPSDNSASPAPPVPTSPVPADEAPSAEDVDDGAGTTPPAPPPVAVAAEPDDLTEPVPIVDSTIALMAPAPVEPRRRRLGVPILILIALVLGLLVAGVAIAISMVGWSELRSKLHSGTVDVFSTLVTYSASVRNVTELLLGAVRPVAGAG